MKKDSNKRPRDKNGHFLPKAKTEEAGTGTKGSGEPEKRLSPKARVRNAQMKVIEKVENILDGNCASATQGNYKCAEFVLDWSGASDLRTPLVKEKKKSLIAGLIKLAQKQQGEVKTEESPEE